MKKLSLNEMATVNGGGFGACVGSMFGFVGSVIVGVAGTVASGPFAPIVGTGSAMVVVGAFTAVAQNCPMNN